MRTSTVAVIGGGQMGAGIAQSFLASGCGVTVIETLAPDAARRRIADGLEGAAQRGKLVEDVPAVLTRLTVADAVAQLPTDVAIVV